MHHHVDVAGLDTDYPAIGVHNWKNWEGEMGRMIPDLSNNIG
ncbi:hypothetical protein [Nocardia sp. NPDC004722]